MAFHTLRHCHNALIMCTWLTWADIEAVCKMAFLSKIVSILLLVNVIFILSTKARGKLYDPSGDVVVLDHANFAELVYNSDKAWFVEFYSSWCGHCVHFAPTWKSFAEDLRREYRLENRAGCRPSAQLLTNMINNANAMQWAVAVRNLLGTRPPLPLKLDDIAVYCFSDLCLIW